MVTLTVLTSRQESFAVTNVPPLLRPLVSYMYIGISSTLNAICRSDNDADTPQQYLHSGEESASFYWRKITSVQTALFSERFCSFGRAMNANAALHISINLKRKISEPTFVTESKTAVPFSLSPPLCVYMHIYYKVVIMKDSYAQHKILTIIKELFFSKILKSLFVCHN